MLSIQTWRSKGKPGASWFCPTNSWSGMSPHSSSLLSPATVPVPTVPKALWKKLLNLCGIIKPQSWNPEGTFPFLKGCFNIKLMDIWRALSSLKNSHLSQGSQGKKQVLFHPDGNAREKHLCMLWETGLAEISHPSWTELWPLGSGTNKAPWKHQVLAR